MRGSCLTGPIVWLLSSFNTHLDLEVPLAGVQTLRTLPPGIVSRQEVAAPQLDSISKASPVLPSELFKSTKLLNVGRFRITFIPHLLLWTLLWT